MAIHSPISRLNRILLVIGGIALLIVVKVPMWRINLSAPQYPEGLSMFIYPGHLGGNIDIINGLNHYIGMKRLRTEDFFEFSILPGIIIGFAVLFFLAAFTGKRWMTQTLFVLFVLFGIIAMFDFWRWEYNYGHNLNPEAPIIVPGMAYQPPLIGFKQLLNFGAYSIPALGGWIFVGVGLLLFFVNIKEWIKLKKITKILRQPALVMAGVVAFLFLSCNTKPTPLVVGTDICSYCKMPYSDNRFGAELITRKGKIYKFDDVHCIVAFMQEHAAETEKGKVFFVNFDEGHQLIPLENAVLIKSNQLHSPMNGDIAAFSNTAGAKQAVEKYTGAVVEWNELQTAPKP
ncbi:nitrous oxide reductase accessory protein NosL [Hydrotalea sp.]|uniref:nitrous oxide reductase accessory protein NosL n=1 Tax=Hydrotalea sp. TaxID=2881279 RepID=UPI00262844A9|nr:nitrous oxide reductase accessory protein NosL [Hydrotalea sp.]